MCDGRKRRIGLPMAAMYSDIKNVMECSIELWFSQSYDASICTQLLYVRVCFPISVNFELLLLLLLQM